MAELKKMADTIFDIFSNQGVLPGQGVISSGQYDECGFSIVAYEHDTVSQTIDRYWDKLETKCLAMMSMIKPDSAVFDAAGIANLNNAVHHRCDVLINEAAIPVMERCGKFRRTRHKSVGGNTKYVGRLGWAKVYVNPYVKPAEAYVIDRTVLDLSYRIDEVADTLHITVSAKTNGEGITKYLLT